MVHMKQKTRTVQKNQYVHSKQRQQRQTGRKLHGYRNYCGNRWDRSKRINASYKGFLRYRGKIGDRKEIPDDGIIGADEIGFKIYRGSELQR